MPLGNEVWHPLSGSAPETCQARRARGRTGGTGRADGVQVRVEDPDGVLTGG